MRTVSALDGPRAADILCRAVRVSSTASAGAAPAPRARRFGRASRAVGDALHTAGPVHLSWTQRGFPAGSVPRCARCSPGSGDQRGWPTPGAWRAGLDGSCASSTVAQPGELRHGHLRLTCPRASHAKKLQSSRKRRLAAAMLPSPRMDAGPNPLLGHSWPAPRRQILSMHAPSVPSIRPATGARLATRRLGRARVSLGRKFFFFFF